MISTTHRCLFIHVPKTAGQSMENIFLSELGLDWSQRDSLLLRPNTDEDKGPPRLAHLTAREYLQYGYIKQNDFDDYFKFAFVRNPWDRLVSEYRFRKYQFSFHDYVLKRFPTSKQDDYETGEDRYRHVLPQYNFLYDTDGNCLVDFIGRFENLQNDFNVVSERILGKPYELPHKNKSMHRRFVEKAKSWFTDSHKSYSDYYDAETRAFVEDYYARDIATFNYEFNDVSK